MSLKIVLLRLHSAQISRFWALRGSDVHAVSMHLAIYPATTHAAYILLGQYKQLCGSPSGRF